MLSWMIFKNYLLSRRSGALVRIIAWHCILGVGMGVAALIIVLSVMSGFNLTIRKRMLSVEPHLVFNQNHRPTEADETKLKEILNKIDPGGVDQVNRFESQDLIIRSIDGAFGGAVAKGYAPQALHALLSRVWKLNKETTPAPDLASTRLRPNEIILGFDLARSLGVFEGDEVTLVPPETLLLPEGEVPRFHKFKVKSLLNTDMPEYDAKLLFYNLDQDHDRMKSLSRQTGFEIRLKNPYEADHIQRELEKYGLHTQTWGERDSSLFFALKMERFAMTLFLSLAVLITSFSVVTVMVLLMNQKRRDIGMMMALGMSARQARAVFLRVGLLLSSIGIFGGALIGTAVAAFLQLHPLKLLPDIYTDSTLPANLTPQILYYVLLGSCLIAVLGSWLPVWRYAVTNPSETLRKPAV